MRDKSRAHARVLGIATEKLCRLELKTDGLGCFRTGLFASKELFTVTKVCIYR